MDEKELRNLLHFFLCQLQAECTKLLDAGGEFDEQLRRIDSHYGGEDVRSCKVSSWQFIYLGFVGNCDITQLF
jgi:hypothetical protein